MVGHQVGEALRGVAEQAGEVAMRLQEEHRLTSAAVEQVATARRKDALELASHIVSELSAERLAVAKVKYAYGGFERRDPLKAMPKEHTTLSHEVSRIQQDERYQRRDALVGPYGSVTRSLEEATDHYNNWHDECLKFEALEGFLELIEVGYDTPNFTLRWWDAAYWRVWANGDKVCAALGLADFGDDVLPVYERAHASMTQWFGEVKRFTAERDAVLALVRRHDEAVSRLSRLPELYLDECRRALGKHLEQADPALLESWNEDDRVACALLRRVAGLKAKGDILEQLKSGLEVVRGRVGELAGRCNTQAAKLMRPKKYHAQVSNPPKLEKMASTIAKADEAVMKAAKLRERVIRFADYERFPSGDSPELWYLLMVGQRASALTPQLAAWYDRHPEVVETFAPNTPTARNDGDDFIQGVVVGHVVSRALDDLGDVS
ncbi:MAG: hypothetical protein IPN01_20120 [Deltaproteobacteria bacterium]|nr:hypothetical protein [Deltaproteobacteria bacterium]